MERVELTGGGGRGGEALERAGQSSDRTAEHLAREEEEGSPAVLLGSRARLGGREVEGRRETSSRVA